MHGFNPDRPLDVLVADDDPVFRSLVKARLCQLNCTFHEAADGGAAWQITRGQSLDFAIVDFEMPGLDGIALTQCLRGHSQTRHIPIVLCTSRSDSVAIQAALEAGVSAFLNKPLNWALFESHIRHLYQLSQSATLNEAELEQWKKKCAEKDALLERLVRAVEPLLQLTDGAQVEDVRSITRELHRLAVVGRRGLTSDFKKTG